MSFFGRIYGKEKRENLVSTGKIEAARVRGMERQGYTASMRRMDQFWSGSKTIQHPKDRVIWGGHDRQRR